MRMQSYNLEFLYKIKRINLPKIKMPEEKPQEFENSKFQNLKRHILLAMSLACCSETAYGLTKKMLNSSGRPSAIRLPTWSQIPSFFSITNHSSTSIWKRSYEMNTQVRDFIISERLCKAKVQSGQQFQMLPIFPPSGILLVGKTHSTFSISLPEINLPILAMYLTSQLLPLPNKWASPPSGELALTLLFGQKLQDALICMNCESPAQ